ncbi:N-acetylmuramoyl-L-alanine amidase [Bacillus sp. RG28]|uniref:N-acetylmuramoyl-L-alanine amidase n=1 Tax=Gottfriedia endophytica TaxID=2820819 RepID=A0A940NM91_9BACI|nr:N-acetylmuramoyl-L-alanine amidase [Gottfriedia endophytica]MBP0724125.1 N-acetylmuramoyl-L-alanine amidase [Gottfriedia endophytica]
MKKCHLLSFLLIFLLIFQLNNRWVEASNIVKVKFGSKELTYLLKGKIIDQKSIDDPKESLLTRERLLLAFAKLSNIEGSNTSLTEPQIIQSIKSYYITILPTNWLSDQNLKKVVSFQEFCEIISAIDGFPNLKKNDAIQTLKLKGLFTDSEYNTYFINGKLTYSEVIVLLFRWMQLPLNQPQLEPTYSYTTLNQVTLKEGPSYTYPNVKTIPKNTLLTILKITPKVALVKTGNSVGYIPSNTLSSSNSVGVNQMYGINTDGLNVRSGPSTSYPVIQKINKATKVQGYSINNDWLYLSDKNLKGYISIKYTTKLKNDPSKPPSNQDDSKLVRKVIVDTTSLNVRSDSSTSSLVIGSVKKGEILVVLKEIDGWLQISKNNSIGFVSKQYVKDLQVPNSSTINIAIDAGHGGTDPGTSYNGLVEKDITLKTAQFIKESFLGSNVNVILTRDSDQFIPLGDRVKIAKNNGAILFVSIHVNSGSGENGGGTETYYYGKDGKNPMIQQSQNLAKSIQTQLLMAWNSTDRGTNHGNFQVIRDNNLPAVLTELGFIDSQADRLHLSSQLELHKAANAIHDGIIQYLQNSGYQITN